MPTDHVGFVRSWRGMGLSALTGRNEKVPHRGGSGESGPRASLPALALNEGWCLERDAPSSECW